MINFLDAMNLLGQGKKVRHCAMADRIHLALFMNQVYINREGKRNIWTRKMSDFDWESKEWEEVK